jgi:hypothetical protein
MFITFSSFVLAAFVPDILLIGLSVNRILVTDFRVLEKLAMAEAMTNALE